MKKYDLIMDCEECNERFVDEKRVIEYAKNRLIANPDDINDLGFDSDKIGIVQAIYIINFYNEEAEEVSVTKDNIHLYYEFMSEQDLIKNRKILDEIFDKRRGSIKVSLTIGSFELSNHEEFEHGNYRFIYKCSFFGAKDTLKPIDEYIADIKASSEYKEYKKNTHLTKDEIRNYRTGMMPNSPNYRKQCAANRLRS